MWLRIMILSIFVSINIFTRLILFAFAQNFPHSDGDYTFLYPKICLGINVLDSEFVLPYFMGMVEDFRYPKDQIYIKFFCEENGSTLISRWVEHFPKNLYRSIESTAIYKHENWREEAIVFGRRKSCAFVLLADTDTFLLRDSLRQMTSLDKIVVSPLLHSPIGTYSNAQALMLDEQFLHRNKLGFIRVYYSNGPLLINLKNSDSSYLTFEADNLPNYAGERRPIDVFASSAYSMDIPILFSNHFHYGYFLDSAFHSRKEHLALFSTFLASWFSEPASMPFPVSVALEPWYPVATKFGFDEIYMINLDRRPERLEKMREVLRLVGLQFTRMPAVDGYNLTRQQYSTLKFLPDYLDPYHKRPMKLGEIGCFLSHYKVWESIVQNGHQRAIVLEDDVRFTQNGTLILFGMVEDLMKTRLDWDLIYLGRKKMTRAGDEFYMQGHRFLSTVAYSYWTLGYAISLDGAKKLLAARPLQRLLALDEFLPIMYNQHPNPSWSGRFEPRNLHAFALYPMAVQPERYTHEPGYVSDTEASPVVDLNIQQQNFLDEIQPNLEVERATTFGKEDL